MQVVETLCYAPANGFITSNQKANKPKSIRQRWRLHGRSSDGEDRGGGGQTTTEALDLLVHLSVNSSSAFGVIVLVWIWTVLGMP